jgi:sulfur relay (sulfurtransferase) DsrC/TusE family protein
MPHKKKVASSYLKEFYGPFNSNEPNKLYRKEQQKQKKREKFQSKDMRTIG